MERCTCGAEIVQGGRGPRRKYCSAACRKKALNAARYSELQDFTCEDCGVVFQGKKARLCPECRYRGNSAPGRGRIPIEVGGVLSIGCTACGEVKPTSEFPPGRGRGGTSSWCRACYKVYNKAREDRTIESGRRSKYGISIEDQRAMWAEQKGCCAACERPFSRLGEAHLDHDHATGRVRAFLCAPCNHIVGRCGEDREHLLAVAGYLERM